MIQPRRIEGLTLVELLVLLGMLALLLGVGFVAQAELRTRAQLGAALTTFETEIERARRLAKSEDREVTFQAIQEDGTWTVVADGRRTPLMAAFSTEVELTFLPPYGTLDLANAEGTSVTVRVGSRAADITVVGVLARTVVER